MKLNYKLILILALALSGFFFMRQGTVNRLDEVYPLPYSSFIKEIHGGTVKRVVIDDKIIKGESRNGDSFIVYSINDNNLVNDLLNNGVEVRAATPQQRSLLFEIFISWFPMLLLVSVWIWFMRKQRGPNGFSMGKSKHRMLTEQQGKITFEIGRAHV